MNERHRPNEQIHKLRQENEALRAQIERSTLAVQQLNEELAETNRGVLVLYAELDDTAQALRGATELKSRFLSYMSHEFRTPLGAIRSIARILLDKMDGPLTAEQEKQINFMQKSASELSEMVDDLLDLARIEAGRITVSPAWFEMVDLFAALRGMFKPLLTNETVTLMFCEPTDVPRVYTDDKKLSQILRNYISNALKFTEQGEIRVEARREGENAVTFSVSDTGIGIAKECQSAVFQDFTQIDSPLQRKWRCTGLGLAVSKKIAEVLGGRVDMTSEPGHGSIFSVTVPIQFEGRPNNETTATELRPHTGEKVYARH